VFEGLVFASFPNADRFFTKVAIICRLVHLAGPQGKLTNLAMNDKMPDISPYAI
jgi:hypothetical protein